MTYRFIRQMALNLCLNNPCWCRWLIQLLSGLMTVLARVKGFIRHKQNGIYVLIGILFFDAVPVFVNYGGLRFEQALFFLVLPFTLQKRGYRLYPRLTVTLAIVFLLVFYIIHVYSVFYLGLGLAILTVLMLTPYRPTLMSYTLLGITAPVFQYLFQVFSFSIRLQLTRFAGQVLKVLYPGVEQAGNRLVLDNISYTVAPGCLGLNMLTSALVIAVFLIAFQSGRYQLRPGIKLILMMLIAVIGFVIIGNVSRIILTVIFKAMPDTLLHELLGLLVFVANVCLPMALIVFYSKRFYKPFKYEVKSSVSLSKKLIVLLILLVAGSGFITKNQLNSDAAPVELALPEMCHSVGADGVVKLSDEKALVYIKPPAFFLGADHNPFICWRASGYDVTEEAVESINGTDVYTFMLVKDNEPPLFSCWWYSNGKQHTSSQLKWRLAAFSNEAPYSVINVSAGSRDECLELVEQLLNK